MVGELWVAIYAPKGTPREAVNQMRAAVAKVQAMPEMDEFVAAQGAMPLKIGPAELLSLTRAETEKWGPIVRESGMKVD
jgi:tripartite-type tricarboxylate transporter receptor subunit TctC